MSAFGALGGGGGFRRICVGLYGLSGGLLVFPSFLALGLG